MNEKIFDIITASKDTGEGPLPCEIEAIITKLKDIPRDVALDYSDFLGANIDEQLVLKNIVSSSNKPHVVRHLVEELNETQLERLKIIVTCLVINEREAKIKELVNATLGTKTPTPESKIKASKIVEIIKELNIDHINEAVALAEAARLLCTMSNLLVSCNMGDDVEALVLERLSLAHECELDRLLEIGSKRLVNND